LASPEATEIRRRHAAWCLALAEEAAAHFLRADELAWFDRVEGEFDNIRAAVAWMVEQDDAEAQLRLASALWRFLRVRGHMGEGRRWLEHGLATGTAVPPALRSRALFTATLLAYHQNDYPRAVALVEELLALSQEIGNEEDAAWSRLLLGICAMDLGNAQAAEPLLEEATTALRERGMHSWLVAGLSYLGLAANRLGQRERAVALAEEAIALQRQGPERGMVTPAFQAFPLETLAAVAQDAGDHQRAVELYRQSIAIWEETEDTWHIADCLTGLADIAGARRQPRLAASLLGAAEALRETLGSSLRPRFRDVHERALAAARAGLGDEALAAAWAEGRAMPLAEAIATAARVKETIAIAGQAAAAPMPRDRRLLAAGAPAGLTPRELEVLRLIAEGLPDREIAARMFVSHRTVTSHVTNILNKLGVASRSAAVAQAVRHGLA
jgi:non-specific serine/threonine protein kinase